MIPSIIAISVISITTILFIKYILYDDIVERNMDKILSFFVKDKKKVKK